MGLRVAERGLARLFELPHYGPGEYGAREGARRNGNRDLFAPRFQTEPDWDLDGKFVENVHQRALSWDEVDDTHPLTFSVSTPDEIVDSFDPITLDKSATVFRMLRHMVGETNFKTALNKYLNDFALVARSVFALALRAAVSHRKTTL